MTKVEPDRRLPRREFLRSAGGCLVGIGILPTALSGLGCSRGAPAVSGGGTLGEIARKVTGLRNAGGRGLTVLYPKGSLGNLTPVVARFRERTGVDVELREASLDEISGEMIFRSHIASRGTHFDVAIPATFAIPDLVEAGTIQPLDEFAALHEPPELAQKAIYTLGDRYKGRLYGYQTDGDAYTMFYLKDWMEDPEYRARYADRFGAPLRVPETWQELDRQLEFFHAPEEDRFGGSLYRNKNYIGWEFWVRLHSQGVFPLSDEMEPRLDGDPARQALEDLISASRHLDPRTATDGLFENFESFAQGNKYCNIGWGGTQKYLNGPSSAVRNRLSYGPLPGGTFDGTALPVPYFNWGWNYVVSSSSTQQELAYLFVLFASTPEISTLSVREPSGYFDPFREEHYRDSEIRDTYGSEFLDVQRRSLTDCIPDLYLRGRGRYFAALRNAVHAADRGQVDPARALRELTVKWNRITDDLGRDEQILQWRLLKESYPEPIRRILA